MHSTSVQRTRKNVTPRVEPLEERACPTTVKLVGDTLRITGDNGANNVRIVQNDAAQKITVTCDKAGGGTMTKGFSAAQVAAISVAVKGGNDRFQYQMQGTIREPLALNVDLGKGKDYSKMNFGPCGLGDLTDKLSGNMRGTKDGDSVRVDAADYHGSLAGFIARVRTVYEAQMTGIYVNGIELAPQTVKMIRMTYKVRPPAGHYWYDNISGAAGIVGQGTGAFLPAGLQLGGSLRAEASAGTSGIFVNGRELADSEVAFLQNLTGVQIAPDRYFVDGAGNAGFEGGPVLINLVDLARQRGYFSTPGSHGILSTYDKTGVSVLSDGSFTGILIEGGGSVTFGD